MKYRQLKLEDIEKYKEDIYSCYMTNHLVFDSQNPLREDMSVDNTKWFVETFINSSDAVIVGIFDSEEKYLYGLVIFDNIRFANKSSAQVHIVNDKSIFGRKVRGLYEDILATCMFDTLYAEIPSMAVHAIALCKRLGFKKTGYIPDILPYVNCSGEEKMYDIQIWTWRRVNAKI